MSTLQLKDRENKKAKQLRKSGKVPGIMYGKEKANFLFELGNIELDSVLKTEGEHALIDVEMNGEPCKALIKEVQRNVITKQIEHIDLAQVNQGERVVAEIPIHFAEDGVQKGSGIVLQKEKSTVKLECPVENMPKSVDVSLKGMKVGDVLRVGDMEFGEDLTLMEPCTSVVVSLTYQNKIEEEAPEAEATLAESEE